MLVIAISCLGVPGPEGETRGLGAWGSGVEHGSTSKLLCDLKPVPCPLWDSDYLFGPQGGHLGLYDVMIQLLWSPVVKNMTRPHVGRDPKWQVAG